MVVSRSLLRQMRRGKRARSKQIMSLPSLLLPTSHSPLLCSLLRILEFSPCFMLHAHATTLSPSYGSSLMFIGVACRNGFIWLRKCLSPEMNEAVCRSDCSNWGERNRRQRKLSSAVRYLARSAAKWDEFAATLPVLNRRFSNAR